MNLNINPKNILSSEHELNYNVKPKLIINDYKKGQKVLSSLVKELNNCDEFIFSLAFITLSGVMLILETLKELESRGVKGKILTTDYLTFSEPKALRKLLQFKNLEVKVFTLENFHTKGYLFKKDDIYTVIVGSSNLTQSALSSNKEWNLKVVSSENEELVKETILEFDYMWEQSEDITKSWLEEYEAIYKEYRTSMNLKKVIKIKNHNITPNKMQINAVKQLAKLRKDNKNKALIISATGTGKTYLSAFDVQNFKPKKLLFLAHREIILKQSIKAFKTVIGENVNMGILSGNKKEINSDYIFSTVQMMSKDNILTSFHKNHFDYIIIDESHKAGANSYLKLVNYFEPKFLLGMTATPERTDGIDIYELFDYNVASEIRLKDAMEEDLLCPFHYFGITDLILDGEYIDDSSDFCKLSSDIRLEYILDKINFYGYYGDRVKGLVFCSRKEEAIKFSEMFNERGYRTVAIFGDSSSKDREKYICMLEEESRENGLDYIFTVDIFNEGIDIPSVNQIVMLRPTESSIIFIQQLGRGLRKSDNKEFVVILDFIGNYKNNFLIPIALSGDRTYNKDNIRKYLFDANNNIPGSSSINFDKISKQKIYEAINNTNFEKLSVLKEEYLNLKNRLGRIPMIIDFYDSGSIDPKIILDYSKSYYLFLKKVEKKYNKELSDDEKNILEFVSTQFYSGKRPHELIILNLIISNKNINLDYVRDILDNDYNIKNDEVSIKKAISILSGGFLSGSDKKKYSECILIEEESNFLKRTILFEEALNNLEFLNLISDVITYSLKVYEDNYIDRYDNNNLTLYKKYSRKDICRLLNWDSDESSVVYGYKIKYNTCPIFVTYNKSDEIDDRTKYEDKFINKRVFSWLTKNNRTLKSNEVKEIISYKENDLDIHLFIKKEDGEGRDFYYLGLIEPLIKEIKETHIEDSKGNKLPIVNINFKLKNDVRDDVYDYLTLN